MGAHVTPHEAYFGRKLNMRHLWVFGSIAYVHVLNKKRKKLDPKAKNYILIEYLQEQKGYKHHDI